MIVAHRGASFDAPENTLAAFDLAWKQGADAIEGDFYMTADGQIVCHHDRTTKKTAGVDVPVEHQTLAQLREHDVGSWKDPKWAGERIPTLQEVIDTVPSDGVILIEIKSDHRVVPALAEQLAGTDLADEQVVIISFKEAVIAASKHLMPHYQALWITDFEETPGGGYTPTAEQMIETAQFIRADGVDVNANAGALDRAMMARLRRAGLEVHVWTINDPTVARDAAALGVDSITTDRPRWLRREMRRR